MNKSGIRPVGDRVLILPDQIERTTDGGIIIPETVTEVHELAQSIGVLIDVGEDAWIDYMEKDSEGKVTKVWGRSSPYAKPGDRVSFAKYGGLQVVGEDGKTYRLMNDVDITAVVSDRVDFTDIKARQPFARKVV